MRTPTREEANDNDHESSDQVTTEPNRSTILLDHDGPTNYEEVMMSPNSHKWLEAMKSKIRSMYENKVWTLVDLPNDRKAI